MSSTSIGSKRPLSPHLTIHRLIPTMAMSILHRITGVGLYFGVVLMVWWLLAAASGEQAFATANGFLGSWFGQLLLLGFTWALLHHLFGGLRHLIWDTGAWMEKKTATRLAWATIGGSLGLTVLVWALAIFN